MTEHVVQIDIEKKYTAIIVAVIILCTLAIISYEMDRPVIVYNVTYVTDNMTPPYPYCDPIWLNESNNSWF